MDDTILQNPEEPLSAKKSETLTPELKDNLRAGDIRSEIDKLPEVVKKKYNEELKAFSDYLIATQQDRFTAGKLGFPITVPAMAFRGYLLYLRTILTANIEFGSFLNIKSGNDRTDYLLYSIAVMSIVANGGIQKDLNGGKEEEGRLGMLEKHMVEVTVLEKDYPLFLKLAEDGGPEFSRLASRLLFILKTRNLQAQMKEVSQREAAISESLRNLRESKDWQAMRLLPIISDKTNPPDAEKMFWLSAMKLFGGFSAGLTAMQAYQEMKGLSIKILAGHYLRKYYAEGEQVKDTDIEELAAICFHLVLIPLWEIGNGHSNFVAEESKSLRDGLFAYLGEIIGPKFLQKTTKTIEVNEHSARSIGLDGEELRAELAVCMKIISGADLPDFVDEKFLLNAKELITEGHGFRKILENRAMDDIFKMFKMTETSRAQNVRLSSKDSNRLLRDLSILNLSIDGAESPEEMRGLLAFLIKIKNGRVADKIYEKAVNKYWQMPGAMQITLERLEVTESKNEECIDIASVVSMLTPTFLKRNPNLLEDLTEELLAGNYRTFQNACTLSAVLITSEKGWGEIAKAVAETLFTKREDCLDPNRVMVLRNILQTLEGEERDVFFKKCFAEKPFFIGVNAEESAKLARMLDIEVEGKDRARQLAGLQTGDFGELKIEGRLVERETKKLVDYIVANRSIMLSGDGKMLAINPGDSPLAGNFSEIKFSLNKEARKNPKSLACNIGLKLKNGSTWYFSIDADDNLLWRSFREGKFVATITLEQLMAGMPETVGPNGETNKEILDEINYLILKKLEELYVRKTIPAKDVVTTVQLPVDAVEKSAPPDSGPIMTEGMSQAEVREERPGVLDLADQFAEATRMVHQDLESGSEDEKEAARQVRMKIGANRELALQIFGKALARSSINSSNGSAGGRLELAEEKPAGLADLIVYKMIVMDSEKYFVEIDTLKAYEDLRAGKINSREIFVRSGSAHSQALPYLKVEAAGELGEGEIAGINKFWKGEMPTLKEGEPRTVREAVLQAKAHDDKMALRMEIFASSRENKDINLRPREKILYFDVDDLPQHREIFERMKKISEEEIRTEIGLSMRRDLKEKLGETKARLVNPVLNGAEYMAGVEAYELEKIRLEAEGEASIASEVKKELEIQSRFTTVTQQVGGQKQFVKLRLPAAFNFNQTFNQGKFQSLGQLFESLDPAAKKKYDDKEVA